MSYLREPPVPYCRSRVAAVKRGKKASIAMTKIKKQAGAAVSRAVSYTRGLSPGTAPAAGPAPGPEGPRRPGEACYLRVSVFFPFESTPGPGKGAAGGDGTGGVAGVAEGAGLVPPQRGKRKTGRRAEGTRRGAGPPPSARAGAGGRLPPLDRAGNGTTPAGAAL
jgi:hypothetical protein